MKLRRILTVAAVVFGFGHAAVAGTVGGPVPSFTLALGSDVPDSDEVLTPTLIDNGDGSYAVSGSSEIPGAYSIVFDFTLNPDPVLAGSFTLTNLSGSQQTFSVSATLGTVALGAPTRIGGGFAEVVYTDTSGDGTVGIGADIFYSARMDGSQVQPLGSFSFNPISGGPGISLTQSAELFGEPVPSDVGPALAGSIGVAFPGFTLTAGDQVELQAFAFVVVPEASEFALFAISIALILLRFARERAFSR